MQKMASKGITHTLCSQRPLFAPKFHENPAKFHYFRLKSHKIPNFSQKSIKIGQNQAILAQNTTNFSFWATSYKSKKWVCYNLCKNILWYHYIKYKLFKNMCVHVHMHSNHWFALNFNIDYWITLKINNQNRIFTFSLAGEVGWLQ